MRRLAVLDDLADDRDAGGAQQLAQLGEIVALGQRGDAERALLGAPRARFAGTARLAAAAMATALLQRPSSVRREP